MNWRKFFRLGSNTEPSEPTKPPETRVDSAGLAPVERPWHVVQRELEAEEAALQQKYLERKKLVDARLVSAAPMEFVNDEAEAIWQSLLNPSDERDWRETNALRHAERWARLMQLELAAGKPLAAVYMQALHDSGLGREDSHWLIPAMNVVCKTWKHGAELERLLGP